VLLAEDLLLLVTDDDSGKLSAPEVKVDLGLGGANLVELTLMHKVDITREGDEGKRGRLIVRDCTLTGDRVLDAALEIIIARQTKRPSAVIRPLSKTLRRTIYERLAASGVIRAQHDTIVGVFQTRRWPTQDASHETEVRRLITEALVHDATPDARTGVLIALLHALGCEHKIVDPRQYGLSKRQLRTRASEIAEGDWASEAVRKAIDEIVAVIAASSSIVATAGSG
jgi:hypothetical protein